MKLRFSKMHGLGNDFVIINNLDKKYDLTPAQIKFISDRKFGIGCDQVLIIDQPTDKISDFYYRIYNSDGTTAQQCGNGARCFIRYVVEHGLTAKKKILLQTMNRIVEGEMLPNGLIVVNMGVPDFEPTHIPLQHTKQEHYIQKIGDKEIRFAALSMGNPHAVIYVNNTTELNDDENLVIIGRALQESLVFPQSVNVNFVYIETKKQIQLRTYERGCGFTLACGSGACASAAVTIRDKLVNTNRLKVCMPGGELEIIYNQSNILMCGNAAHVFAGEIQIN